jgi:hypothetical protein
LGLSLTPDIDMSIGSINGSALASVFSLKVRSQTNGNSTRASSSCHDCGAGGPDVSSPSQSLASPSIGSLADLNGLSTLGSHLALQIRSRSQQITASDGTVSERSSTKLRFHYDLTTADGQHIELNVKAKVQEASVQDAAGNFVSKSQVKLQFSLLQEGVSSDLSPLQSDQVPSATQSGVAGGLQDFLTSVGDAVQQFTSGDNVSADDLVTKTVDTFNTLLDALSKLLFPTSGNVDATALPPTSDAPSPPPADPVPLLSDSSPAAAAPALLIPPPPQPPVSDPTSDATSSPPAATPTDDSTSPAPSDPATEPASVEPPASEPTPAADSAPPPADSAPAPSATQLATQVLQTTRLRFTQSLTQIIQTLNSQDQSGNSSTLTTQRLSFHSSLSLQVQTASLLDASA